ncbi:MAG: ATP-binding cassette domain-containing protein [Oscillospiraceae bacterium]|nr:ATP-binding cassette domain-containing protein [Oscillospiraceae bacterium]MDY2847795.1 ATP-binding cassette domain-containing protein [Oscillospiraceae bacterium]
MSIISINDLTFGYEGSYDNVFENVSLDIDSTWRLGLVGRNGKGKTTLLKLLCSCYEYSGSITSEADFGYFPYNVEDEGMLTGDILGKLCSCEDWEIIDEGQLQRLAAGKGQHRQSRAGGKSPTEKEDKTAERIGKARRRMGGYLR